MEIPAPEKARSSVDAGGWHTKVARQLHHTFGFAMRKAKDASGGVECWNQASKVAAGFVRWTQVLDEQIHDATVVRPVVVECKPRSLLAHPSDASTWAGDAEEEDDGDTFSVATTVPWGGSFRKRVPRRRSNRRARRACMSSKVINPRAVARL